MKTKWTWIIVVGAAVLLLIIIKWDWIMINIFKQKITPQSTGAGGGAKNAEWLQNYKKQLESVARKNNLKDWKEAHKFLKDNNLGGDDAAFEWLLKIEQQVNVGLVGSWDDYFNYLKSQP